jgi:hypothetical protein
MMIAADDAVLEQEVEQIGHLLKVRRHVRVIAAQMHVVEGEVQHAFYLIVARGGLNPASWLQRRGSLRAP